MSVRTTVQFTVEVIKSGKFSEDKRLVNLKKIALREAEETLRQIVGEHPDSLRMVGKPKVFNCIFTEDL